MEASAEPARPEDSHEREEFTSGEMNAIRRLYDESPACVDRPKGENNDLLLLAAGVRPAASATVIVEESRTTSPNEVDPVVGFAAACGLERRTFIRRREGFACRSHYLARDRERFDRFRRDGGRLARGRFLGYPPDAIEANRCGSDHAHRWHDYLGDRSPRPEHWRPLAVVPYVPACTDAGYLRALDRGRRYLTVIARFDDTIPGIAEELDWRVERLKSRVR